MPQRVLGNPPHSYEDNLALYWILLLVMKTFHDDKFHFSLGIFHFALEGNALKAIELTEQLAQDILEKNKDLQFDLLSLHFVELVCSRKW